MMIEAVSSPRVVVVGLLAIVLAVGVIATRCGGPSDTARATQAARSSAEGTTDFLRRLLAEHPDATAVDWLTIVASALPDAPGFRWTEPAVVDGDGRVVLDAAFDGAAESGGGLSYSKVRVRVCARYTWLPRTHDLHVEDTGCTPGQRDPVGPTSGADVFVPLEPSA